MSRVSNSTNLHTINEKALTFDSKRKSKGVNTYIKRTETDIIVSKINTAGLESEQSSAAKLAFLMKMVTAVKTDLECKLEELTYEVVCHANGFDGQFTAFEGVSTVIPYNAIIYDPADGSFLDGEFTAGKTGFYDVSAYFINALVIAPVGETLRMNLGSNHDTEQTDTIILNTDTTQLQGSRTVYCQAGGTIYAALSHTYAGDIDFNSVAYPGAGGYISISYSARNTAATLV